MDKKKFRLINLDMYDDVIGMYDTLDQAQQGRVNNYFFMTEIQELKNGRWIRRG